MAGDVGVERQRPVDLDDMDRHQLRARLGELAGQGHDRWIAGAAVQGDDDAIERWGLGFGHGGNDTTARAQASGVPPGFAGRWSASGSSRRYGTLTTTVCGRPSSALRSRFTDW